MPPAYVKTIREEIFYEYAKLISRSSAKLEILDSHVFGFILKEREKG